MIPPPGQAVIWGQSYDASEVAADITRRRFIAAGGAAVSLALGACAREDATTGRATTAPGRGTSDFPRTVQVGDRRSRSPAGPSGSSVRPSG